MAKSEEMMDSSNAKQGNFSDKLDIMKFVAEIKLRLRKDISADFVLARLSAKDKEAIIEMTTNAYFSKRLLTILALRAKRWKWNSKEKKYEQGNIDNEEKNYILKIADAVFDSYMTRIYMTVILNRNVDGNYLVNVLAGYKDEEMEDLDITPDEAKEQIKKIMACVKKAFGL